MVTERHTNKPDNLKEEKWAKRFELPMLSTLRKPKRPVNKWKSAQHYETSEERKMKPQGILGRQQHHSFWMYPNSHLKTKKFQIRKKPKKQSLQSPKYEPLRTNHQVPRDLWSTICASEITGNHSDLRRGQPPTNQQVFTEKHTGQSEKAAKHQEGACSVQ